MAKKGRFEMLIGKHLRDRLSLVAKDQQLSDSEAARIAIREWVQKQEQR
jgi:hypothetical protein